MLDLTEVAIPVFFYETELARVALFGKQPGPHTPAGFANALRFATALGAQPASTCIMKPATRPGDTGYKRIEYPTPCTHQNCRLQADGAVLKRSGTALVMPTRDCASVWVENPRTGIGALGHCGREAMRPWSEEFPLPPIAISLLEATGESADKHRKAWAFGSICPDCFTHESESGQACVEDFLDTYGRDAFKGNPRHGKLHIMKLIRMNLSGTVVKPTINHTCTKTHGNMSSYRGYDDNTCNLTVVVRK